MSKPEDKKHPDAVLSGEEEVTLRRVAYGESPVRTLRAADLTQLLALRLIENGKDGPVLTAEGRKRFGVLPRAVGAVRAKRDDDLLGTLGKALRDLQR